MSNSIDDRRAHPRFSAQLELQGTPEQGGTVARMVADNLSLGGLYCTSTQDYPEMTRLAVNLVLPRIEPGADEARPLDLEAVVVRREEMDSNCSGDTRFKLALFFTKMNDESRSRLADYLQTADEHQQA